MPVKFARLALRGKILFWVNGGLKNQPAASQPAGRPRRPFSQCTCMYVRTCTRKHSLLPLRSGTIISPTSDANSSPPTSDINQSLPSHTAARQRGWCGAHAFRRVFHRLPYGLPKAQWVGRQRRPLSFQTQTRFIPSRADTIAIAKIILFNPLTPLFPLSLSTLSSKPQVPARPTARKKTRSQVADRREAAHVLLAPAGPHGHPRPRHQPTRSSKHLSLPASEGRQKFWDPAAVGIADS